MTDPVSLAVAGLALVVGLAAAWYATPTPPALDGERWFKVLLATALRGQVQQAGGSPKDWESLVVRWVPYHPAGRNPEQKITDPAGYQPVGGYLPGERALVQALAALPDAAARWARLYDTDERALDARLGDPDWLGPDYNPEAILGPGVSWDAVAAWDPGVPLALDRRAPWRWVLVRGTRSVGPDALGGLAQVLAHRAVLVSTAGDAQVVLDALAGAVPGRGDRAVVVGQADAIQPVLNALYADWELRDRVVAVLSVGGVLGGITGVEGPLSVPSIQAAMHTQFRHQGLDVEANITTPYFAVQWLERTVDPPGIHGLPLAHQRFPIPVDEGGERTSVHPVDLGPLPAHPPLDPVLLGRTLWVLVSCYTLAHR